MIHTYVMTSIDLAYTIDNDRCITNNDCSRLFWNLGNIWRQKNKFLFVSGFSIFVWVMSTFFSMFDVSTFGHLLPDGKRWCSFLRLKHLFLFLAVITSSACQTTGGHKSLLSEVHSTSTNVSIVYYKIVLAHFSLSQRKIPNLVTIQTMFCS